MLSLREIQARVPKASVSLHVDDYDQQVIGNTLHETVQHTVQAAQLAREEFQEKLGLPFDTKKAAFLTNSIELGRKVQAELTLEVTGPMVEVTKNLGADFSDLEVYNYH